MFEHFDEQLDIFFGESTAAQARVYARLPCGNWPADAELTGRLTGPTCPYAETLTATYRFVDRGLGDSLLAEAIVPDPCFWTPRMPYLYQAEIELRLGSVILARTSRPFGIRPLGAKGKSLLLEGKRWVLRGGMANQASKIDVSAWHEAEVAMMLDYFPDDKLLATASKIGVLLIVGPVEGLQAARRLARHAAVGMVFLPNGSTDGQDIAKAAPNLVRAAIQGKIVDALPPETQTIMPFARHLDDLSKVLNRFEGPVIPFLGLALHSTPQEVRAACDRLQRDLAPYGDFAGYIA